MMRNKNRRWIIFWFLVSVLQVVFSDVLESPELDNGGPSLKNIYIPRMDYDQWKPLGRGDPLKNDPTYDYVPPVLDRVQYWVDPTMRKPDSPIPGDLQKTEILLLGVTSRKPANPSQADSRRDTYDPYLKYVDTNKFNQNSNQRISRPSFIPPIPSQFLPSFFPQNKNKYLDRTSFSKGTEQRVPYTMLMPPPLEIGPNPQQSHIVFPSSPLTTPKSIFPSSTASGVSVQTANLIYHSSGPTNHTEWNTNQPVPSSISWEQSPSTKKTIPDFRDEVVYSTHLTLPESFMRIEFLASNNTQRPLIGADSNHNINYVTPPPLLKTPEKELMFKGQVSDDDDVDISNTYVKIGKPEAEVHSTGIGMSNIPIEPMPMIPSNMVIFPHGLKPLEPPTDANNLKMPPLTMQKLHDMQTMHPPPITQPPSLSKAPNPLFKLLDKEKRIPIDITSSIPSEEILINFASNTFSTDSIDTISTTTSTSTLPPTTTEAVTTTTTEPATTPTTTSSSLTTDPLFKHYKQPKEPMKGPLYLIIQGHSKVKTYGPTKQMHGIFIQDTNEIPDIDDKFDVKHLHGFRSEAVIDNSRRGRSGDLQTLKHVVETGFGAIDATDIDKIDRKGEDIQETELGVRYEVVDDKDVTEKYHKGIVEEARKLKL